MKDWTDWSNFVSMRMIWEKKGGLYRWMKKNDLIQPANGLERWFLRMFGMGTGVKLLGVAVVWAGVVWWLQKMGGFDLLSYFALPLCK